MNPTSFSDHFKPKSSTSMTFESWMDELKKRSFFEDQELLKELQEHPEWVNQKNEDEQTPLMRAAWNGYLQIVNFLIEAGADLNLQDKDGWTALMYASFGCSVEVVKALIQVGADLNTQSQFKWTALMVASFGGYVEVVQALIQKEVDPLVLNLNQQTALNLAQKRGHDHVIRLLEPYVEAYLAKESLHRLSQVIHPLNISSSNLRSDASDSLLVKQLRL